MNRGCEVSNSVDRYILLRLGMGNMGIDRGCARKALFAIILSFVCMTAVGCGLKDAEDNGKKVNALPEEYIGEETSQIPAFNIKMLKIGKADTALLYLEGETEAVVIDAGEDDDGSEIVEKLDELGVTKISHLIITHYDKDHIGGAAYVLEHIPVGQVIQPDYPKTGDRFEAYQEAVDRSTSDICVVSDYMEFSVSHLSFSIYPENDPENQYFKEDDDNDRSLVTMVTYRNKRFLFTGDIEEKRIELLLSTGVDLNCDWVKIPHHGRFNDQTESLLEATGAKDGVICCSEKNPAERETVDAARKAGMTCWITADGDITFICDGEGVYGNQE